MGLISEQSHIYSAALVYKDRNTFHSEQSHHDLYVLQSPLLFLLYNPSVVLTRTVQCALIHHPQPQELNRDDTYCISITRQKRKRRDIRVRNSIPVLGSISALGVGYEFLPLSSRRRRGRRSVPRPGGVRRPQASPVSYPLSTADPSRFHTLIAGQGRGKPTRHVSHGSARHSPPPYVSLH